ncbi:basic helix-loop-helix and HMG box domain-containing protein 1 [Eumetopias jubatus]|uniref:basic helix-loop-helix and HMG box domain-containing protein 1 n=1 Tax=Eumetopias jubatus TaxID=34886 RepID=UPI001016B207|nr:basic helix-loop-helix and HMG box domain-containing protein 1 [Eumetopias jubatus]
MTSRQSQHKELQMNEEEKNPNPKNEPECHQRWDNNELPKGRVDLSSSSPFFSPSFFLLATWSRTPAPAFKSPQPRLGVLTISPRRSSLGYAGFPHSLLSNLPFRVPAPKPAGNWSPSGHGLHLPEGSVTTLGGLPQEPRSKGIRAHPTAGCQRPNQYQLLAPNRRQRKDHTSKLHELALLLPVALKTGTKKLTKKEILLHVLHYIQYLQKSINVAKALLKFHTTNGEGELGGLGRNWASGPARRRHSTPSSSPHSHKSRLQGACRKPRKKKPTGLSERQTRAQNPRRCLVLDEPGKWATPSPEQQGRHMGGTTTPSRRASPGCHPKVASSLPQGDRKGGRSRLTLLDMAENSIHCDFSGCCCCGPVSGQGDGLYRAFKAQQGAERIHFLNRTEPCPRQKLVFYDSSEELDKESPDADPWLPAWTPEGSPPGSPLALGPPQINKWSVTGHPSEILGLSPSLFSSPGRLPPDQILGDGTEFLTQDLFKEVFLDPKSLPSDDVLEALQDKEMPSETPEDPPDSHSLCQSSVSLDHCYLSLSENSKAPSSSSSSSSSEDSDTESVWRQQEDVQADPEGLLSSSDEDGDYTWTPTRQAATLPVAGRKARKGQAGWGPAKPRENKKAPCPTQMKKKCVNGFIMFCRMNRKQYIRACPGTASTAATKELAQLWRVMTQEERRPYCIKARRFSLQHNRIVKQDSSSSEDEHWGTPKPFYQLLAEKARRSSDLGPPLPPQHN